MTDADDIAMQEDDLYNIFHIIKVEKNYNKAYVALEKRAKQGYLTSLFDLKLICFCVQQLKNYEHFLQLSLHRFGGYFPDVEKLNDNQILVLLITSITTENSSHAIYYSDYLLQYNPAQLNLLGYLYKPEQHRLMYYYLMNDNFQHAWLTYQRIYAIQKAKLDRIDVPYWNGKDIENTRLLISCLEDYGDIIFLISLTYHFLKNLKNAILICKFDSFLPVIKRTLPNIQIIDYRHIIYKTVYEHCDAKIYINDLPQLLSINKPPHSNNILKINHQQSDEYRKRLEKTANGKKIIGVSFYSQQIASLHERNCPLDFWQPILMMDNVIFVNLQYGEYARDLTIKARELNIDLIDWDKPNRSSEFDDFMALVSAMDIVITIDNTMVHQASAIGKPCYVMLSNQNKYWYFLSKGEQSYWYESLIIMRQYDDEDDWKGVIERTKNHILENQFS